jgi:tetratricopeptide (TPR) repeat protein
MLEGAFALLAGLPTSQILIAASPLLEAGLERAAELGLAASAPFDALLGALRRAAEARGDGRVGRIVDVAEGAVCYARGRALQYYPTLGRTKEQEAAGARANALAEPLLRRSLALRERALGAEASETEASAAAMGYCLFHQKNFAEAEPLLRRALAWRERTLGADSAEAIEAAAVLATALGEQDNPEDALPLFARVLEWRTTALGTAHPRTRDAHTDLQTFGGGTIFEKMFNSGGLFSGP